MTDEGNVLPFKQKGQTSGGGTSGGGMGEIRERLVRIETELPHLAKKKDISDLKVWALGIILTALVSGGFLAWLADQLFQSRAG